MRKHRLWLMCAGSLFSFGLLVGRLAYLQLVCHAALSERANREGCHRLVNDIPRGAILDRKGNVLAMSIQGGGCFADPSHVQDIDETAHGLSSLLHIPASTLKAKLLQRRRFVWLARRLDPETAQLVQALHRPGVSVIPELKRF